MTNPPIQPTAEEGIERTKMLDEKFPGWSVHYPTLWEFVRSREKEAYKLGKNGRVIVTTNDCICGAKGCEGRFDEFIRGTVTPAHQERLLQVHNSVVALAAYSASQDLLSAVRKSASQDCPMSMSGQEYAYHAALEAAAKYPKP